MISFQVTRLEARLIDRIVARAIAMDTEGELKLDKRDLAMDITAAHANGCTLRLMALLKAKDFDFLHDVLSIRQHMDRSTGKLPDWYCPRFAAAEGVAP